MRSRFLGYCLTENLILRSKYFKSFNGIKKMRSKVRTKFKNPWGEFPINPFKGVNRGPISPKNLGSSVSGSTVQVFKEVFLSVHGVSKDTTRADPIDNLC